MQSSVVLMTVLLRPRTTSIRLLAVLAAIATTSVIHCLNGRVVFLGLHTVVLAASASIALLSIFALMQLPFRDPMLLKEGICAAFNPPTDSLRSPEDDLTLWQFLTVSWMSPLISLGFKKQLNQDEVWALGFEFEHRTLHDLFHELRGSVTSRILQANWIDLVILTTLALVELMSSTTLIFCVWSA